MDEHVLVVIGVGGMGEAIARRLGSGHHVLLADANEVSLNRVSAALSSEGYKLSAQATDVASRHSVRALARTAQRCGQVTKVVHTAGISPAQASAEKILRVDLYGVALVLDAFAQVIAPAGAGVVIGSLAGHLGTVQEEHEQTLFHTETSALLELPWLKQAAEGDPGRAYAIAKRASTLRVMAASASWAKRGARINSISPGIISTPMQQHELNGSSGSFVRGLVDASALQRMGTASEIAEAAAFLLGTGASFITGTDLLVDAGALAALRLRSRRPQPPSSEST